MRFFADAMLGKLDRWLEEDLRERHPPRADGEAPNEDAGAIRDPFRGKTGGVRSIPPGRAGICPACPASPASGT